jgi:hypothetical protein
MQDVIEPENFKPSLFIDFATNWIDFLLVGTYQPFDNLTNIEQNAVFALNSDIELNVLNTVESIIVLFLNVQQS